MIYVVDMVIFAFSWLCRLIGAVVKRKKVDGSGVVIAFMVLVEMSI